MSTLLQRALAGKPADAPTLSGSQTVAAWWRVSRPPFFIVDLLPVGVGFIMAAYTTGTWPWGTMLLTLLGCFFLHTVANIANELFDYLLGVDTEETLGGTKVIHAGLISPRQLSLAIVWLLAGTLYVGWWLIQSSGQVWLWWLVGFAIFSAVFYVAPPIRYGCRGYGELSVCLNMGFVMVVGSYAVMAKGFIPETLALALPVGLMVAGILYYQSLPEIETDLAAGKHTLANKLGKERALFLFQLWWPAVWVVLGNLWACGLVSWPIFLGLLSIPLYRKTCQHIRNAQDWQELDTHGHLVRKLYLINGIALLAGLFTV